MAGGLIPEHIVEEIKAKNDIVEVVEQYVALPKKTGSNFFGLCPFHSEKTPSFSVVPGKQIFHCFGCNKGGDVINFIREIEHLSYREALEFLADRAGIKLPEEEDPNVQQRRKLRARVIAANNEAARYFYRALQSAEGKAARDYLVRRGVSLATAMNFGLGYAPDSWDGLLKHLQQKGFSQTEIEASGLFKRNRNGGLYDMFRGRLMFPIFVMQNKILAFGGRVLDDSLPKYINSPETTVYTKGQVLYGIDSAKKSKADNIVLVEGYMDVIAMYQAGVENVVAVLGTALTEQQVNLLSKFTDEIILGFDSDSAGEQAAARSFELLERKNIKVRVLVIPDGKDPDEYIRANGAERFKAVLADAMPLLDYRFYRARIESTVDDRLDPIGFQEKACQILLEINNTIVYELYLSKVAQTLGTLVDAVRQEVERQRRRRKPSSFAQRPRQPQIKSEREEDEVGEKAELPSTTLELNEAKLIVLLARNPGVKVERLDYRLFTDNNRTGFPARVITLFEAKELTVSKLFLLADRYRSPQGPLRELFAKILVNMQDHVESDKEAKDIAHLMRAVELEFLRRHRDQLALLLDKGEGSAEEQKLWREQLAKINEQYKKLRSKR